MNKRLVSLAFLFFLFSINLNALVFSLPSSGSSPAKSRTIEGDFKTSTVNSTMPAKENGSNKKQQSGVTSNIGAAGTKAGVLLKEKKDKPKEINKNNNNNSNRNNGNSSNREISGQKKSKVLKNTAEKVKNENGNNYFTSELEDPKKDSHTPEVWTVDAETEGNEPSDFASMQKSTPQSENENWIFYAGIGLVILALAGISFFGLVILRRRRCFSRKRKKVPPTFNEDFFEDI